MKKLPVGTAQTLMPYGFLEFAAQDPSNDWRQDLRTGDIHVPGPQEPGLGQLEAALDKAVRALPVETKLRDAIRAGKLDRAAGEALGRNALAAGIITQADYDALSEADEARNAVVQVDAFDPDTYRQLR